MNDHEIAELVNELRDIAQVYGNTQQLRQRIAYCIVPILKEYQRVEKQLEYEWEQQAGEDN